VNVLPARILVTNHVHGEVLARLRELGEVEANEGDTPWPATEVLRRGALASAVLAFMTDRVDAAFVAACPRLRIVACALKGADNFDADACSRGGVWLSIVPDLLTAPTAELAVGLAVGLGRRIHEGDDFVRMGTFEGWRPIFYGTGLDGSIVAIIGMGAVGCAIAARLAAFGCRLLGVDARARMPAGVEPARLDAALAAADFAILAAPLTGANRHMIGRAALARMKPGALLVNVGRGSVVDEAAVADALDADRLGGYAADVFELEDWMLADRPRWIEPRLRSNPRTLFTPHLGSAVAQVRLAIESRAAENIADALAGRRPRDAINDPVREQRRA
jgi:phosphonate dehydrogenase